VVAKRVVVACGGIHSPGLLHASGLSVRRTQIGKNLTLHPGLRVYARFRDPVRGWRGALQSAYTDHFAPEHVTLMSLFVPPGIIAASMPGAGPRHARLAEQVDRIAMFGVLVHDQGGGVILNNPLGREPLVFYRATARDRQAIRRGIRLLAETWIAAGAEELYLPILGSEGFSPDAFRRLDLDAIPMKRLECASQHPLGSCRMGVSEAAGAVDLEGRVFGCEGLYVADGSVVPSSLGVNPQLTVMAMATRIASKMLERPLRG